MQITMGDRNFEECLENLCFMRNRMHHTLERLQPQNRNSVA